MKLAYELGQNQEAPYRPPWPFVPERWREETIFFPETFEFAGMTWEVSDLYSHPTMQIYHNWETDQIILVYFQDGHFYVSQRMTRIDFLRQFYPDLLRREEELREGEIIVREIKAEERREEERRRREKQIQQERRREERIRQERQREEEIQQEERRQETIRREARFPLGPKPKFVYKGVSYKISRLVSEDPNVTIYENQKQDTYIRVSNGFVLPGEIDGIWRGESFRDRFFPKRPPPLPVKKPPSILPSPPSPTVEVAEVESFRPSLEGVTVPGTFYRAAQLGAVAYMGATIATMSSRFSRGERLLSPTPIGQIVDLASIGFGGFSALNLWRNG